MTRHFNNRGEVVQVTTEAETQGKTVTLMSVRTRTRIELRDDREVSYVGTPDIAPGKTIPQYRRERATA